ncbi:phospholipase D family protein [Billgrantia kenyensis]|uniref:Phospholipase D family protein n=1 Tax=Billgrantia kenyensis TaxID=321266 RepID=A0A7V9W4K8_9GAMM|nr:phospholipase D family protein [Halomonas kenyensis]MBA2780897.1 phospholipase D family protein [Halomonas kenyensis]MCG6663642.1 phospholipase D family protein [Halomonas kenyensis]
MLLLQGCAGNQVVREHATPLLPAEREATWLGQWARLSGSQHPDKSGFALLSSGQDAFSLRVLLSEQADRRLDIQTYLMGDGQTTRVLLTRLLAAAERGVEVRLLVDDIGAVGQGRTLAALDTHPNVQVRVYNPLGFARGTLTGRVLASAPQAARQHRRMHNKLWIADGALAIVGGRNLGDEYYSASEPRNFTDLDLLTLGPVVDSLSHSFHLYWNHGLAQPIARYHRADHSAWRQLQASLGDWFEANAGSPYFADLRQRYADIEQGPLVGRLHWGEGVALWDPPGKPAWHGRPAFERTMAGALYETLGQPKESLVVVSAYFVPGRLGTQLLSEMADSGVAVDVFTNALEATDVPIAHGAYQVRRQELLDSGVGLYELRAEGEPDDGIAFGVGSSASALHIKALGIDDERVFIGSPNADPRSVWWNTEVGVVATSPSLAAELQELIAIGKSPSLSYRVSAAETGGLDWHTVLQGESVRLTREPGGFWRHLGAALGRIAWLEPLL